MALMLSKTYDAFRNAGADEKVARDAAEELATYDNQLAELRSDVKLLKSITGATFAAVVTLVFKAFA